jgi:ribosomal-protein-alanine N-acetyltransferase
MDPKRGVARPVAGGPEVVLRGYRNDDLEAMFRLDLLCFEPRFRFSREQMKRFAASRKARVAIVEIGSQLAGFCIAHVENLPGSGKVGYLVTLDVAPEARRLGLARTLMDRAEADALEAGCVAMMLHVFSGNGAAIGFYERMGYVCSHTAVSFYGAGADALVYHKPLDESVIGRV